MTVEVIIEKLQALNIERVAVFDDQIELIENPWKEDIAWQSIFETYTPELEEALGIARVEEFRNLKTIEERLSALSTIEQHLTKEQLEALEEETIKILRLWINKLEEFGLKVDRFSDFNEFKDRFSDEKEYKAHLGNYHLILLDFKFEHLDGQLEGAHSEFISKEISALLNPSANVSIYTPPILIRFSSLTLSAEQSDKKRRFVKEIGFTRGCYDFLRKNLINEEENFVANLIRIIQNAEYGRPLYKLSLKVAQTISQTAATDVMRTLYQLEPESIRIISAQRLQVEGITALDYFSKLFLGLLNHTLSGSKEVVEATKEFLESINEQPELISTFEHHGLDYVQNRLLFDYQINLFQRPINFGDIFVFNSNGHSQVGIVITQACDMAIRGQASKQDLASSSEDSINLSLPKVENVMLLTGSLISLSKTYSGEKIDGLTKFFALSADDEHYSAIKWDFKKTITLPRTLLDLASLNSSGNVVLPLDNSEVQSQWWTKAYQNYITWVCKNLRKNCIELSEQDNTKEEHDEEIETNLTIQGSAKHKIVLPGTASNEGSSSSTFGSAVIFSVEKGDKFITFPIRRIARLQLAEALSLQHAYHSNASRIGVMVGLSQEYENIKVEIYKPGDCLLAEVFARYVAIENWSGLLVESAALELACRDNEEMFSRLLDSVRLTSSDFDLKRVDEEQQLKEHYTYEFSPKKRICKIKRKRLES